jgi:hypothetical protein
MLWKRGTLLAASLFFVLSIAPARAEGEAEADTEVLLETIRSNRKALVEVNLGLSEEEGKKFWPVYDKYQAQMNVLQERLVKVIEDYVKNFSKLTDDKALELVTEYLAIEAERVKVKQADLPAFKAAVSGRTVARFYQIENKMDAVVRFKLAEAIPVVDKGS